MSNKITKIIKISDSTLKEQEDLIRQVVNQAVRKYPILSKEYPEIKDLFNECNYEWSERKGKLRDPSHLIPFLLTTIQNYLSDLSEKLERKRKREKAVSIKGIAPPSAPRKDTDFYLDLDEIVKKLPELEQKIWQLVYLQELTQQEAAEKLHLHRHTIANHWEKIKQYIKENYFKEFQK